MIVIDVGRVTVSPAQLGPTLSTPDGLDGMCNLVTPGDWPQRSLDRLVRTYRERQRMAAPFHVEAFGALREVRPEHRILVESNIFDGFWRDGGDRCSDSFPAAAPSLDGLPRGAWDMGGSMGGATTIPVTDTARLDWLEAEIRRAAARGWSACVVLAAWYSKPGTEPDGYSVNVGEYVPDADEHPTLRAAIDDAMADT